MTSFLVDISMVLLDGLSSTNGKHLVRTCHHRWPMSLDLLSSMEKMTPPTMSQYIQDYIILVLDFLLYWFKQILSFLPFFLRFRYYELDTAYCQFDPTNESITVTSDYESSDMTQYMKIRKWGPSLEELEPGTFVILILSLLRLSS
jgi:hypothetical protein